MSKTEIIKAIQTLMAACGITVDDLKETFAPNINESIVKEKEFVYDMMDDDDFGGKANPGFFERHKDASSVE